MLAWATRPSWKFLKEVPVINFIKVRLSGVQNVRQLPREEFGEGAYELIIPAREIDEIEGEVLNNLFPNTQEVIREALQTEALIAVAKAATRGRVAHPSTS
jgi:hypothetical protein